MGIKKGFGSRELYSVVLLCLVNLFLFADQNLMAPNLTGIARDFGLNDMQRDAMLGGQVALGFWVLGGVVTLGIGYLTDLLSRKKLFVAVVLIGAIPCFLTAFAQNYEQFFVLRALTGIGLGGIIPLTYSLLGDYFSHDNRSKAAGMVKVAGGFGTALGQMLAGFTSSICIGALCGWRIPFVLVAAPAFLIAILFWVTIKEPERGRTEDTIKELIESGRAYSLKINWREYRDIFKIKTNVILIVSALPGLVPWSVFFVYLNDFFSQERGYSIETATLIVMVLGVGVLVGVFIGGVMGDFLYKKNPALLPLYVGMMVLVGIVPMVVLIKYPSLANVQNANYVPLFIIAFLGGIVISQGAATTLGMLLNVNAPETRGSIFSLFNLVDDLGRGFGPVVVSQIIMTIGREKAFLITPFFWIPCAFMYVFLYFTFPKDEAKLAKYLKEKSQELSS